MCASPVLPHIGCFLSIGASGQAEAHTLHDFILCLFLYNKTVPQCKKILRNVDSSAFCSAFDEFKWFLVRNFTMPLRKSITGIAKIWRMFEWISMSTASAFIMLLGIQRPDKGHPSRRCRLFTASIMEKCKMFSMQAEEKWLVIILAPKTLNI